ncbi:hypothetical protein AKJ09_08409 [Labilithrix luteola]|uniref:Lipoprotein n=1 Tax=Labilithrix luteola TaxID=1391654 RepID=A0A0K1Q7G5_9BACT|nr:hypothetical protein AKJ09_08409 [Labilithrix luteola]
MVVALLAGLALPACRPMLASSGDLADYRAFRVAAAQGTRLARAQRYLHRNPNGAFATEVRQAFETEEPRYFARAQSSRAAALDYLADLPNGPHAAAALALVRALESNMEEAELSDIAQRVRHDEAKLETAAAQRRAVGDAILGAVGVLLDDDVYGMSRAETPPALRRALLGPSASTWGGLPETSERDLFFVLPTRPERESRVVTLRVSVIEKDGRVATGRVEGADLFVLWYEADRIAKLDPASAADRTEAQVYAMERLAGALERRFPESKCPNAQVGSELYHRSCDGWEVVVSSGAGAGAADSIVIRGVPSKTPARFTTPDAAGAATKAQPR